MTQAEQEFCRSCCCRSNCGYVNREMETSCITLGIFSEGYEQAVEKACNYLKEHKEKVETEDNGIAGWISDYFIKKFKNAMEE